MDSIRQAAVSGMFYASQGERLQADVDRLLAEADEASLQEAGKALIVPHAGFVYSGPVAASAYRLLRSARDRIERVVLLGPAHRVFLRGIAAASVDAFATPLGLVPLDRQELLALHEQQLIEFRDDAHEQEHSLEVQLPFLQTVLERFTLLPLLVGDCDPAQVAVLLQRFWQEPSTLIVVSSDLSHFHPYAEAQALDATTSRRIESLDASLHGEDACGCHALNGLLQLARKQGASISKLDLRNSGDTAGDRDRVVGYGSYAVYQ